MLLAGEGVAQNIEEGIQLLKQAAEADQRDAQFELGNCYLAGKGVDENEDLAMEWFEKAADNGHEKALKITGRRRRK
jgi:TPR repeat protein